MIAQIPSLQVYPRPEPGPRDSGEPSPFGHMLLFVAVSLVALAGTQYESLAELGFWRAVSALAAIGAIELFLLLASYAAVRLWASSRRS